MSTEPPPDISQLSADEFRRLLLDENQKQKQIDRQARYEGFPPDALLWMALPPAWTVALAQACGLPRIENAPAFLEEMERRGLMQVIRPPQVLLSDADRPAIYKITDTARAEILSPYLAAPDQALVPKDSAEKTSLLNRVIKQSRQGSYRRSSLDMLRKETTIIGDQMTGVGHQIPGVPAGVLRWAALARFAYDEEKLVYFFESQVENAFRQREAGEILNWIEAGRSLAALMARDLETRLGLALYRAGRLIELLERRAADLSFLAGYMRRGDQIAAFNELMDGPDNLWALHYLGAGGVGKTMLIRDLTAHLTGSENPAPATCEVDEVSRLVVPRPNVAAARIDFDYLSADYPRLAPGMVLWSFARELRPYDTTGSAQEAFDECERYLDDVHREISRENYRFSGRATDDPRFATAVSLFIAAVKNLDRRVLLILDTCEELAKAGFLEAPQENIRETFRILRALHDGPHTLRDANAPPDPDRSLPDLRVIFSGRRPLAFAGHLLPSGSYRWQCAATDLPDRPYLRLHVVHGFSFAEARFYMHCIGVPGDLVEPILKVSSPETGSLIKLTIDGQVVPPVKPERCSPYQFRMFTDWALESPPPRPEDLLQARSRHYVEMRIIRRLDDEQLERLLPAVALLGHFDYPLLKAVSDLAEADFDRAYIKLQAQEWVDQQLITSAGSGATRSILVVEKGVRERLLAYFSERQQPGASLRKKASAALSAFTRRPFEGLAWVDFDAALRVMETDPEDAAQWWEEIELRLVQELGPEGALGLLANLLGEDGAVGLPEEENNPYAPPANRLRPFVLATFAALQQSARGVAGNDLWKEVEQACLSGPDLPAFHRLSLRALAGQITAGRFTTTPPGPPAAAELWSRLRAGGMDGVTNPPVASAFVTAAEELVEFVESQAQAGLKPDLDMLFAPPDEGDIPVKEPQPGPALLADLLGLATQFLENMHKLDPEHYPEALSRPEVWVPMQAYGEQLAGRAWALIGEKDLVLKYFSDATARVASPLTGESWPGWKPPTDLASRIGLEYYRAVCPAFLSPKETVPDGLAITSTPLIDRDRQFSLALRLSGYRAPITQDTWIRLGWWAQDHPGPGIPDPQPDTEPPGCAAHNIIPPLYLTCLEEIAALGFVEAALDGVTRWLRLSGSSPASLVQANQLYLAILSRMRLLDLPEFQIRARPELASIQAQEQWAKFNAISVPERERQGLPQPADEPEALRLRRLHLAWQTWNPGMPDDNLVLRLLETVPGPEASDFYSASLQLDLLELALMADIPGSGSLGRTFKGKKVVISYPLPDPASFGNSHPNEPEETLRLSLRRWALEAGYRLPEGEMPRNLLERVGLRRAARLAQEEGQLLALRLPWHAEKLLYQAAEWYVACSDNSGALLAQASYLLAYLHRGENQGKKAGELAGQMDFNVGVARLKDLYAAQAPQLGLPPWTALEEAAASPDQERLDRFGTNFWQPWLARIVYILIHLGEKMGQDARLSLLREWLANRTLAKERGFSSDWLALVAELAKGTPIVLGASSQETKEEAETALLMPEALKKQASYSSSKGLDYLLLILVLIVGIGLLALLIYLGQLGLRKLAGTTIAGQPALVQIGWLAGGALGLALVGFLAYRLAQQLSGWWLARSILAVEMGVTSSKTMAKPPGRSQPGEAVEVELQFAIHKRHPAGEEPVGSGARTVKDGEKYADLAPRSDWKPVAALMSLARRLRRSQVNLVIRSDRGLHGFPWETMIVTPLRRSLKLSPGKIPFRIYREVRSFAQAGAKPLPVMLEGVTAVTEGTLASETSRQAWARTNLHWSLYSPSQPETADASLVHLIGRVVEHPDGLRFRTIGGRTERLRQAQASTSLASQSRVSGSGAEFSTSDLVHRFRLAQLCVLSGPVVETDARRSEIERHNASLSRQFAAELVEAGLYAALTLPPMKPEHAVRAIQPLASALRGPLEVKSLAAALSGIQSEAAAGRLSKEDAWESALDVNLFVRAEGETQGTG